MLHRLTTNLRFVVIAGLCALAPGFIAAAQADPDARPTHEFAPSLSTPSSDAPAAYARAGEPPVSGSALTACIVIGIEPGWTKRVVDGIAKTGKPVEGFAIERNGDINTIAAASMTMMIASDT